MQTFDVYQCSVKESGGKLNFYFQSGGIPDDVTESPQKFKKGALLFSLMETRFGAKTKYQFQSAAYRLVRFSPKMKNRTVYFKKI